MNETKGTPDGPDSEVNQIEVNIGGVVVGTILFFVLIWSMWTGEIVFGYLTATLLFALGVSNHVVNMMYK